MNDAAEAVAALLSDVDTQYNGIPPSDVWLEKIIAALVANPGLLGALALEAGWVPPLASASERAAEVLIEKMPSIPLAMKRAIAILMDDPELLGALAIEAGWVPPNVTTSALSHIREVAARLDDFDD